jgi:putative ABC transport system ATP-binding protein
LTRRLPSGGRSLTILDDVSLAVDAGEFVAVLGPSGSGKSTLLGLAAGLDRPTSGEVLVEGRPIQDLSEDELALLRRHQIGFVFQSFQLLPNFTARENVRLPLELLGRPRPGRRADELLELVGLAERGHHYPSQLSGGEQQRVALARAFAAQPPLLLADEPTGNLDSATGRRVLDVLVELQRRHGTTLVLVTHDPAVAALADRLVHLQDGRIAREERPGEKVAGELAARRADAPSDEATVVRSPS